jgi:hypothetical protein
MTEPSDAANTAPNAAPKKKVRGKPFPKGRSGNPVGMRPGTRHRMTLLAEELMTDDVKAVIAKVVRKAKAGDMSAARMILDRIVPPRKGRAVLFPLPPIKTTGDVVSALAAITAAMSGGQLSPAEALEVSSVVELQRRAIETQEIEVRLHALEERLKS